MACSEWFCKVPGSFPLVRFGVHGHEPAISAWQIDFTVDLVIEAGLRCQPEEPARGGVCLACRYSCRRVVDGPASIPKGSPWAPSLGMALVIGPGSLAGCRLVIIVFLSSW